MKNLEGQKFGRLKVIKRILPNDKWNDTRWLCECECGNKKIITKHSLNKGTKSCGCIRIEKISTHGLYHTRIHKEWEGIKARCKNSNDTAYQYYGGRGIKICDAWDNDFMNFYNWSMSNGYEDELTIDRINSDGNYEPNNCRWVNMTIQQRNRRDSVYTEINGITKHLLEWADEYGIKRQTLITRYYKGERGEKLIRPVGKSNL